MIEVNDVTMCNRVVWLEHRHMKMIGKTKTICVVYESS